MMIINFHFLSADPSKYIFFLFISLFSILEKGRGGISSCILDMIYILQHVEALEILLQGLCGVHKERLRIHEICLKSGPNLGKLCMYAFFLTWSCMARISLVNQCVKLIRRSWNGSLTFCKPILKSMKIAFLFDTILIHLGHPSYSFTL